MSVGFAVREVERGAFAYQDELWSRGGIGKELFVDIHP